MTYLWNFLKGAGIGAANVIPGVSGGTIALLTGIFERLINALKSMNLKALKLLFTGKFKEFAKHIDLAFLITVFLGVGISIISLAYLLKYLFAYYPIFVWAFFFGLILASVYYVGKSVKKKNFASIFSFVVGAAIAASIAFVKPATENDAIWYLIICGAIAVCSMILPGLSGSFILILLGNYRLVMIDAVTEMNLHILLPIVIGAVVGLLAFSHVLAWLFKKFKDQTLSLLTGFILGSLAILWPWKHSFNLGGNLITTNENGAFVNGLGKVIAEEVKVSGYDFYMPDIANSVTWIAIALMVAGLLTIAAMEFASGKKKST
ncbi:MAG: DUF368 domain-containing protein [Bacteroidales bacterium]|nr:DUF368 domain-containing protein [Bacteroidales bacterium]